jgi:hypothetical protein
VKNSMRTPVASFISSSRILNLQMATEPESILNGLCSRFPRSNTKTRLINKLPSCPLVVREWMRFNNSLNPTRPSLLTCGTLNYALPAMPVARIRARGLAQKGCVDLRKEVRNAN